MSNGEQERPERVDIYGIGRWTVEFNNSHFGAVLDHGLEGGVMLMGLPRLAGWRAISHVCLPHQTYVREAEEWLSENRGARKIAVLGVKTGNWATVWETGWPSGVRADWMPPREELQNFQRQEPRNSRSVGPDTEEDQP